MAPEAPGAILQKRNKENKTKYFHFAQDQKGCRELFITEFLDVKKFFDVKNFVDVKKIVDVKQIVDVKTFSRQTFV